MSLSVAQIIPLVSPYTVGINGDISTDSLALYQNMVAGEVEVLNHGRFLGDDLTLITAWAVLDKYVNMPGKGTLIKESVKDNSWQVKTPESSSFYRDCILQKIEDFDKRQYTSDTMQGVIREDAYVPDIPDGAFALDKLQDELMEPR